MPYDVRLEWPWPLINASSKHPTLRSRLVLAAVGSCSKIWIESLNRTRVHNRDALYDALNKRPDNQPLITFSNHYSCLDDPLLWGLLRWSHLVTNNKVMRWTLGASDIVFTRKLYGTFFPMGRVVPVVRGNGVYQRSMDFMLEKLNEGGWVHTFSEGKVNMTKEYMRLKWGIGRLVAECQTSPLVIPLWHLGLDDVLPNRNPYFLRIGKHVTVCVGDPIDLKEQFQIIRDKQLSPMETRKLITDHLQEELFALRKKAELLHQENCCPKR